MTILLATNLVQQARRLADRVAFLNASRLIEVAPTDVIFSDQPSNRLTFEYVRGRFG
jgi:phosphate transport system ATP-binding protein